MENYYNPFERLSYYLTYFVNGDESRIDNEIDYGYTIAKINESTGIPLEIIRKDITEILHYQEEYPLDIDVTDDEGWTNFCKKHFIDETIDYVKNPVITDLLLQGEMDNIPFVLSYNKEPTFLLPLSIDELAAIQELQKNNMLTNRIAKSFLIKNSYRFQNDYSIVKNLREILYCIHYGCGVSCDYLDGGKKRIQVEFAPLKIMYDSLNNVYAALAVKEGNVYVYRLDRIVGKIKKNNNRINKDDVRYIRHADQVWGMSFRDKVAHRVKVLFFNEGNVWNKVKSDLSFRVKKKLYEQDGYLIYEDIVYGISAFRAWVYSYGSSAIVLEPKELRDEIIEMLKERMRINSEV